MDADCGRGAFRLLCRCAGALPTRVGPTLASPGRGSPDGPRIASRFDRRRTHALNFLRNPSCVLRSDAAIGLFGMIVTNEQGFLAEVENREALAMAVDRAALLEEVTNWPTYYPASLNGKEIVEKVWK